MTHYTGLKLVEYSIRTHGEQQNGECISVFQTLYCPEYGIVLVVLLTVLSPHLSLSLSHHVGLSCDFQVYDAWHPPAPPSSRTLVHPQYSRDTALEVDLSPSGALYLEICALERRCTSDKPC